MDIPKSITDDSKDDIIKVAKGAGISFFGSVIGRGFWFLSQVIIARFFGAEIFGLYILGLVILKMTELLARFGLHTGAMKFVSIYRKDDLGKVKGVLISSSLISFLNGILIGGLVFLFASLISESIFHKPELTNVIKTFAFCIPFMATMMVVADASCGFHTTKYNVYIKDVVQPLTNLALILVSVLLGFDIYGVIGAFVISHIIALFAGFLFIVKEFPGVKKRITKPIYEVKTLLTYSAPLLFSSFLMFLISWTDTIMLGFLKTSIDVGIYRAAAQIPAFLLLILMASNSIYAPAIAEMHNLGHRVRIEKIFKTTTRWIFYLTLPAALILIFSAKEVMSIFGPDFIEVGPSVLMIITIAQFINCITGGVGFTLNMTGKQNIEMINSLALVVINIALNYFLIPAYGSLGAAIATGISIGAMNIVRLLEVYILYRIHPYSLKYVQGVAGGVIAVVMLYILGNYLRYHSYLIGFISNSLVVGIIFIVTLFITGIHDEDRFLFDALSKKFNMRIFKV